MTAWSPSAVWRDKNHRWRIEAYRAPDLRFAVFATNGTTESAPLWLFGMAALARWLMTHAISLDDLETGLSGAPGLFRRSQGTSLHRFGRGSTVRW